MSKPPIPPPPPKKKKCKAQLAMGDAADGSTTLLASPGVNANNGQVSLDFPLLSVAALGGGAWEFGLNYISGMDVSSSAGLGFSFTQNPVLSVNGTIVTITAPQGFVQSFAQTSVSGSTVYYSSNVPLNVTGATLVRTNTGSADEVFTLTTGDGTAATYSGVNSLIAVPGRLVQNVDRYGNTQTFNWVMTGGVAQLTAATDGFGRTVTYAYYGSEFGYKLQQVTDYLGRQANFQFDSLGHLIAAVLPSINKAAAGNGFPGGTAYVFQYDVNNSRPQRQNDLIAIWYPNEVQPYPNATPGSSGFRTVDVASVYASATPRYQISYGQDPTDTDVWGRVTSLTAGGSDSGVGGTANYLYSSNPADMPINVTNPYDPIVFRTVVTDRNGNQSTFDFNANQMPVRVEQLPTRSKLIVNNTSFQTPSWVTWTVYDPATNEELAVIYPEGNSVQYTYENGKVPNLGTTNNFYAPRRGLLLSETRLPGNNYNVPSSRSGSGGQTQLVRRYFYDPIFNQQCAIIEERGNPITVSGGVNVYYTPQNGTAAPTDANRSAYATITYFDYQKNQTSTIIDNAQLQSLLGLTAAQIQTLISYVNAQMTDTTGTGGIPAGFQTNLGDINGDGTGNGTGGVGPQESVAAPMVGNTVKVQNPSATVIGSASITTQSRIELFTVNARGQTTTHTDGEGNITVYVRYPENDPNGDGTINPAMSSQQYGQTREVHVDVDPNDVMSLVGASGDLLSFNQSALITRTNTPGVYQDLVTRYEGDNPASAGCVTCAYDALGNPTAVTDPRGFTTITERNEVGKVYRNIGPAPYNFTVETYYDANGNVIRTDTLDSQVQFDSSDPTSPVYGQFTPTGSGFTAHAPMVAGPGGTVRPGWFTNLYTFNILDWKIQDDIDATGSNPGSLATTYSYDPNGNQIQITKPEGNIVEYDYDERNLRIAQRVGYTTTNPSIAAVTIYIFDNNGNSLAAVGPAQRGTTNNSLSATIADAFESGASLTHTGDWVLMNTIDGFDRVIQATDAVGGYTATTYDPGSRPIEADRYGTVSGATPTDRTGAANQLLSTQITRFDEAGRKYEDQANVLIANTVTLPSGRAVTHAGGGLASNSTANNHNQTVTLTTGGQSYVLTRTVYDRADRPIQSIGDNTAVSTTSYDGASRAIESTDPLGNTVSTQYDGNSNPILTISTEISTITAPATATETFQSAMFYDCLNKPIATATQGADGSFTTDLTQISYSNQGSPPATMFTLTGYDSRGNKTAAVDAKGNSVLQIFDGASRPLESQQLMRQNGLGNQGPAANSTFQSAGRGLIRTQTLFDGNSRMFQMIDDRGATTDYSFDTLDRQVSMEFADGSARFTEYDLASDIITYTDENGSVFNNTWDCLGRKINVAITPASGSGGTTQQTFQYDGLNRPTQNQDITSSGTVQVTLFYDSLGRSIEEAPVTLGTGSRYVTNTAFVSSPSTQFTYPNSRQVNSNYDVLYRRKQVIEAATSAVIVTWQFYGPGRIAEVVLGNGLACTYLNNARTNSAVQSGVANPPWGNDSSDRLGYDGSGRNITKRYLNSTLNAQNGYANTTALVGNTTAYDRTGNKFYERALQAEERDSLYQPVDSTGNIASPAPGYDSVSRLLQYQRGTLASTGGYQNAGGGSVTAAITLPNTDQSRNYTLDGLGNWRATGFTPVGGSATTDQRNHNYVNEITQRTLTGGSAVVFQYDGATGASNGNLKNDGALVYSYDALNRPIQINRVSDGLIIATYLYDAMNRRVRETVTNGGLTGNIPDGAVDYIYMGRQVVEERDSSNAPIRQYIWGTYIDECIELTTFVALGSQNLAPGSYYLLQDLLYRAVALTNSTGVIVEAYDCDAYGNTLIFTGPGADGIWFTDDDVQSSYGANEIIYCGYRFDPETELYYVRNRSYNSVLGRWIQRDPVGYAGGINLYEYVGGRALSATDASGASPVPTTVAGMYAAFTAGRGNWSETTLDAPGKTGHPYTANMNGQFNVDKKAFANHKCPPCKEIKFVQFYIETHVTFANGTWQSNGGNWALDLHASNSPPFYAHQTPWEAGGRTVEATMWDYPGIWGGLPSYYQLFEQDFMTWAVCTKGKEAGRSYGALHWGLRARPWQGMITVWLVGATPWVATVAAGTQVQLKIQ